MILRLNLDSTKTLFVTNSAVSKDKDRQSFKLRPGMDKKIVIYVHQMSNKELAIERYVLSLHREDILIQKSLASPITSNNSFINDKHVLNYVFSVLKCSFQAMRTCRMVFLYGDWCCVELKPTLPECTAVLFCLYMFSQALHMQMGVWICVVPVCFCCSEEHVCVSGVSVCSWAQGRT